LKLKLLSNMPKTVKKKTETILRRIQPDRKVKKRNLSMWPRKPRNFDLLDDCISNFGLTGSNLAYWIFSYLDFSSLQQGRLVCKSWCRYLTNCRLLWLNNLMRSKPYLENLFNKLSYDNSTSFLDKKNETTENFLEFADEFFERIKNQDNLNYGQMVRLFGKIQTISIVIIISRTEDISDLGIGLELKRNLIGEHLFEGIIVELEKMRHPFYNWLRRRISTTKSKKQEIKCLKKEIKDINATLHLFLQDMRQFLIQISGMMAENVISEENEIQKSLKIILQGLKRELYLDLDHRLWIM